MLRKFHLLPMLIMLIVSSLASYLLNEKTLRYEEEFSRAADVLIRMVQSTERIVYLDEVLTMSARMYALTSKKEWKTRYLDHVPHLDEQLLLAEKMGSRYGIHGVVTTDEANQILIAMEEESFRLVEQGQSESAYQLLVSEDYQQQKTLYSKGIQQFLGQAKGYSEEDYSAKKRYFDYIVVIISLLFPAMVLLSWMVATHLLTRSHHKLKDAISRLEVAYRAKDEFLAAVSHELRTPLTVIIGNCEVLAERESDRDTLEMIDTIERAGYNQLSLVNDVLDISKIESGRFTIDPAPFDLSVLLLDLARMFRLQAEEEGIQFDVEQNSEELFKLLEDGHRVRQILTNLIGNALKFTEYGSVRLSVWNDGRYLLFNVVDTGIGMSPETIDKLFERFEQADGSISRRFGGSGLGLYISLHLAEMMGGEIDVSSKEGAGSIFQLRLPYRPTDIPVAGSQAGTNASTLDQRLEGHVLIAEDTPELQRLERKILESIGVTVTTVENGKEALAEATKNRFDLILMDMQMPEMDGIEATYALRALQVETPIVALTANVMQHHREQFEEAGCNGFLSKPIDRIALREVLYQYLSESDVALPVEDPGFEIDDNLLNLFKERSTELHHEMISAHEKGEWQQVRRVLHNIKGSGTTFGFPELTTLSGSILKLIDSGNFDIASKNLTDLDRALAKVVH